MRRTLSASAKEHNAVSIISAGWDPGSDSIVRTLLEAIAPKGITYTNFGPGMSMGHTVAVKAIDGVKAALSMGSRLISIWISILSTTLILVAMQGLKCVSLLTLLVKKRQHLTRFPQN